MTITIADGRGALWQWDTGRRVRVDDSSIKQVHYQNKCFGRSVDMDVGADGTAIIPDELLRDWHPLTAYAYVTDDAGGYTKVQVDFAVHKRAKPADYVFTPTDQMTLQMIQRQIGDLADLTTEAKENLVDAINEAAASGGGSPDAVLYTPQTLTDAQKKQARENVDAAIGDFSVTATIQDFPACTLDKTFSQIKEAISKGKRVFALLKISSDDDYILSLWKYTSTEIQFTAFDYNYGLNKAQAYKLVVSPDKSEIAFGAAPTLTSENTLQQVEMAAGPSFDMEIATKQYVDTHATGGTGMGITGATVGQIAKIASVDASGVPTAWSPADMPSGGSSDFVIIGTVTGETLTTDKTYEQVQEAVQAGKRVTLKVKVYGIDFVLSRIGENSSGYLFATAATIVPGLIAQFTASVGESGQNLFVNAKVVSYDSDGNLMQATMDSDPSQPMEIATKQYVDASGVPPVTAADNGKFLRVVNGEWAAIAINDANGVSF